MDWKGLQKEVAVSELKHVHFPVETRRKYKETVAQIVSIYFQARYRHN
jgi:hypothetical protein